MDAVEGIAIENRQGGALARFESAHLAAKALMERAHVPGQPGLPNDDVSRDGQRSYMIQRRPHEAESAPIHVLVDWLSPRSR